MVNFLSPVTTRALVATPVDCKSSRVLATDKLSIVIVSILLA